MNNTIEKIIKERQTVKSYSDKKISESDWNDILSMIYWSPSSHGFEPYRVIVVNKENKLREKLKPMMWNQGQVTEADKLILFITLDRKTFASEEWVYQRSLRKLKEISGKHGKEADEMARKTTDLVINTHLNIDEKNDDWAMKQAYLALGNALTAATILNIGSTPMEGMKKTQLEKFLKDENLIKENEKLAVAAAFGYPSSETAYAHFGTGKRIRDKWEYKFTEI